tara:strand:+ start:201 stop:530 length:330 start_codon:yes stop_codon:yes gene_type:complete
MSRVMRRTPYDRVRFAHRELADGTYAQVAVTPCDKCSAWKVNVCNNCPSASSRDVEVHIEGALAFIHNMEEDRWERKVWCDVKHEYTFHPDPTGEDYHYKKQEPYNPRR